MAKFEYMVIHGTTVALEEQMSGLTSEGWRLHTSHIHFMGSDGSASTRHERVEMTWILEREEPNERSDGGLG